MGAANIRETLIGVGGIAQTDLVTANIAADYLRINKLNAAIMDDDPQTEDDALEIGKGSEFAQNHFLTSWNVRGTLEKYLSSEMAGWLFAFGLGKSVATLHASGTLSHDHTATPLDATAAAGIDIVPFSVTEQIRPGSGVVVDKTYVGCGIEDFTINLASGPGRNSSRFTCNYVGTGKVVEPSTITLPTSLVEHLLPASSMALSINGVDYVAGGKIMECELSFKNNIRLDTGYYPGSGFRTASTPESGQIRGRMEFGDRVIGFRYVARFLNASSEFTKLKAGTEGTLALTLTGAIIEGAIRHKASIAMGRMYFSRARVNNQNGIVSVEVEGQALLPLDGSGVTGGLLTTVVTNALPLQGAEV